MSGAGRISRRTMLRGAGAAIALPWLEAMGGAHAADPVRSTRGPHGSRADGRPLRTLFVYHPLGAESVAWKGATGEGRAMKLTPTLAPLEPVKEHLLVLDGLDGRTHPRSGHNRSACLWLGGALPGKADAWGVETDVTVDRLLAERLGTGARVPSLELSCTSVGELMHATSLSWRAPGVPVRAEQSPREVFARMFGDPAEDRRRGSILDVVRGDARRMQRRLGAGDQRRLDEYLDAVRALERQVAAADRHVSPPPDVERPGEPRDLREHVELMLDLAVVAVEIDFARVVTCALGDESEGGRGTTYDRTLAEFGIDRQEFDGVVDPKHLDWGHHKCTHDPAPTLPMIRAIDRWYVARFARLLQKLAERRDGDGTLLDRCLVAYGSTNSSGSGNGWPGHSIRNVACLLAGRANGLLPRPGRVLDFAAPDGRGGSRGVPLSNLWLTVAQLAGLDRDAFGASTGTLSGLG